MTKINLKWRVGSTIRSRKAEVPEGIYFIQPVDDGYQLTFQGSFVGKATYLQTLQDYAIIDLHKRRQIAA
jgi:hypothetical protein